MWSVLIINYLLSWALQCLSWKNGDGGSLYCDPPIQGTMVWTKLTHPREILVILYKVSQFLWLFLKKKKKKINPLMGNTPPLGWSRKKKLNCLKSGRFDPWTFILFPKASLKAVKDQEATPTARHEHNQMEADFQDPGLWWCFWLLPRNQEKFYVVASDTTIPVQMIWFFEIGCL